MQRPVHWQINGLLTGIARGLLVSLRNHNNVMDHARSPLSRTYSEIRVSWLDFQFSQHPYTICQFDRLIKHILSFDVALGHSEHIIIA
jgi:hypothetical protein